MITLAIIILTYQDTWPCNSVKVVPGFFLINPSLQLPDHSMDGQVLFCA